MRGHIDLESATAFIRDRFGARATVVEPLGEGHWSRAFAFDLDGEARVIRFGQVLEDFRKDEIMSGYSSEELPVPQVDEIGTAPGGYFCVSQRATGAYIDDLDGREMQRLLPSLFRTLDATAAVRVDGATGFGLWDGDREGESCSWAQALLAVESERPRIAGWRSALESCRFGAGSFDRELEVLRDLSAQLPDEQGLVHNDLLNKNVLVSGDHVSAVLDWGNSLYGDPLYDMAVLLYWWEWCPQWAGIDLEQAIRRHYSGALDPEDLDLRLSVYRIHVGIEHQAYNALLGLWDELERNIVQTDHLIGAVTG